MISDFLFKRVFPRSSYQIAAEIEALSQRHLKKCSINSVTASPAKEVAQGQLEMPKLVGQDIREHFYRLGQWLIDPHLKRIEGALSKQPVPFPSLDRLKIDAGWHKYDAEGNATKVAVPDASLLFLDVETCEASKSKFPILAVAFSVTEWYVWLSEDFLHLRPATSLIPIGTKKLIIGHHVAFDRSKLLEEYDLADEAGNIFLCTMSLNSAVSGLCHHQRSEYMHQVKNAEAEFECERIALSRWAETGSLNSLAAVHRHYCGVELPKEKRDLVVNGSIEEVFNDRLAVIDYCKEDTRGCYSVFCALWPKFRAKCPHPVSLAGIFEMGKMILPTESRTWKSYIECSDRCFEESRGKIQDVLLQAANQCASEGECLTPQQLACDPWLKHLDWTLVTAKYTKARLKKDGNYCKNGEPRLRNPEAERFFGKPAWFRSLFDTNGSFDLTLSSRITHYLLKLRWKGHPVQHVDGRGWCFVIDPSESSRFDLSFEMDGKPNARFVKIPHFTNEGANVGDLFAKSYISAYESGILTGDCSYLTELMQLNMSMSFWKSYQERIKDQFVIDSDQAPQLGYAGACILPTVATMGTVTRRAVERTWQTLSDSKPDRIGSEAKSRITAPDGYVFVGADVDSEELWIASVIGDSQFGFHGASALGWMTLQGSRADKTDMHSRTADILGISRNDAKTFNYGRIYGCGPKYAVELLMRFNKTISLSEAKERVNTLYSETKGRKAYIRGTKDTFYYGGTESFMFTRLEREAKGEIPRTPALGAAISNSLLAENAGSNFLTSRINWIAQSSGVDYLHMLIVSMRYLCEAFRINARLAISVHDEVRYLVQEVDQYRAALALQISNLWTRAAFSFMLGMEDLPMSVAFFSLIEIDKILRKDTASNCVTPSSPTPIAPGDTLDIYQLLTKVTSLGGGLTGCADFGPPAVCSGLELQSLFPIWKASSPASLQEQVDGPSSPAPKAGSSTQNEHAALSNPLLQD